MNFVSVICFGISLSFSFLFLFVNRASADEIWACGELIPNDSQPLTPNDRRLAEIHDHDGGFMISWKDRFGGPYPTYYKYDGRSRIANLVSSQGESFRIEETNYGFVLRDVDLETESYGTSEIHCSRI